jgi:hypothetical protein
MNTCHNMHIYVVCATMRNVRCMPVCTAVTYEELLGLCSKLLAIVVCGISLADSLGKGTVSEGWDFAPL